MIDYVHGDATLPTEGARVLAHICNDVGRWGKGFVVLVGKAYPMARAEYLAMDARPFG